MRIRLFSAALAVIVSNATFAAADVIKVEGGAGPAKNVLLPVKDAFEKASGHTLQVLEVGGTKSFKDLMAGSIDMASAGFSFNELLQTLAKEGVAVPDKNAYTSQVVASARVYVYVNKDNPVSKLTKDQIKGIFSGKISNWKEVGGADVPVVVALAGLNPATNITFQNQMLDGAPYVAERGDVSTTDDLKGFISGSPESVGFGPSTMAGAAIKQVETPEVSRVITFITKGAPSAKVKALIDFVTGPGQSLIKK